MATGPRGRSGGDCRTGGGGRVWAERRAAPTPPARVVEEAGWARVGSGGGEKPAGGARWRRIRRRRARGRWIQRRRRCHSRGGWVGGGGKKREWLGRVGWGEGRLVGGGRRQGRRWPWCGGGGRRWWGHVGSRREEDDRVFTEEEDDYARKDKDTTLWSWDPRRGF
jgi:hypothetical protein